MSGGEDRANLKALALFPIASSLASLLVGLVVIIRRPAAYEQRTVQTKLIAFQAFANAAWYFLGALFVLQRTGSEGGTCLGWMGSVAQLGNGLEMFCSTCSYLFTAVLSYHLLEIARYREPKSDMRYPRYLLFVFGTALVLSVASTLVDYFQEGASPSGPFWWLCAEAKDANRGTAEWLIEFCWVFLDGGVLILCAYVALRLYRAKSGADNEELIPLKEKVEFNGSLITRARASPSKFFLLPLLFVLCNISRDVVMFVYHFSSSSTSLTNADIATFASAGAWGLVNSFVFAMLPPDKLLPTFCIWMCSKGCCFADEDPLLTHSDDSGLDMHGLFIDVLRNTLATSRSGRPEGNGLRYYLDFQENFSEIRAMFAGGQSTVYAAAYQGLRVALRAVAIHPQNRRATRDGECPDPRSPCGRPNGQCICTEPYINQICPDATRPCHCLHNDCTCTPERRRAFHRSQINGLVAEAAKWSHLSHDSLLPFLGLSYHPNYGVVFVSPLYDNADLSHRVYAHGFFERLHWVDNVAQGLKYLHECRCYHRDIKPANILIRKARGEPGTRAMICDYGSLKVLESGRTHAQLTIGAPLTLEFAPPEIFDDEGSPLEASRGPGTAYYVAKYDVYSFALLAYCIEMRPAKMLPFGSRRVQTRDIKHGMRPPIENPNLPNRDVIEDCWKADPQQRPTMIDVAQRVRQSLNAQRSLADADRHSDPVSRPGTATPSQSGTPLSGLRTSGPPSAPVGHASRPSSRSQQTLAHVYNDVFLPSAREDDDDHFYSTHDKASLDLPKYTPSTPDGRGPPIPPVPLRFAEALEAIRLGEPPDSAIVESASVSGDMPPMPGSGSSSAGGTRPKSLTLGFEYQRMVDNVRSSRADVPEAHAEAWAEPVQESPRADYADGVEAQHVLIDFDSPGLPGHSTPAVAHTTAFALAGSPAQSQYMPGNTSGRGGRDAAMDDEDDMADRARGEP